MRARNLKPGLFKNEKLGSADPLLTILFEGLWCMADREGRLEDRPLRICAEVFPYRRSVTEKKVDTMLDWLQEHGFIARYEVQNEIGEKTTVGKSSQCIQVLNFLRHNNPHKHERPSEIPALTSKPHSTSTGQAPGGAEKCTDVARLNPESGILNPESSLRERRARARPGNGEGNGSEVLEFSDRLGQQTGADCSEAWRDTGCDAKAMQSWLEHKRASGKPLPAHAAISAGKMLLGMGAPETQRAAVELAIANNWQALRPQDGEKALQPGTSHKPVRRMRTAHEIAEALDPDNTALSAP
jgi:hypothetical protein